MTRRDKGAAARATEHIGDLVPDPRNARRHTPRNVGIIADALREVGAARSIVIDENNVVLAGNATIDAAAEVGITRLKVVEADGEEIVAVRRSGLTAEAKTRLALFDNRAAELAEWDERVLAELRDEGATEEMFSDYEIAQLLGETPEPVAPEELWRGMPEFEQEDLSPWRTIRVHFTRQEDLDAFSRLVDQTITTQTKFIYYPPAGRNTNRAVRRR